MSKSARNRRIKHWAGGNRRIARRFRRVYKWNGIIPGLVKGRTSKSKQPLPGF